MFVVKLRACNLYVTISDFNDLFISILTPQKFLANIVMDEKNDLVGHVRLDERSEFS
jgi:hypothetical protein